MKNGAKEPWEAVITELKSMNTAYYGEGIALNHGIKNSLIDRLTTGENARRFWVSFCRNAQLGNLKSQIAKDNPAIAYFCLLDKFMQRLGHAEFKRPAEHKKELLQIADLAKKLRESLLTKTDDDDDDLWKLLGGKPNYGYSYLGSCELLLNIISRSKTPGDEISWDARHICREACTAKQAEEDEIVNEIMKGTSFDEATPEQDAALENYELTRDKDWLISRLNGATITSILSELEERALKAASDELVVKRAKDRRAAEIKWLGTNLLPFHTHFFGSPLWDTLALAITLCLDLEEPLTADDIRPLLKDQKSGN